ncbi:MAG: hypothetical protein IPG80_18590 [Anaerolineales bacterium]|uniref:hypothetical protein n=1 Tax=Candidatus Villigracilis vicinus TaxID=3140679 RepID=UPI0031375B71|nr:hypothetical protein [Anaerolineales bacterium]MBK7448024.1 hypothetical protein [Anaerolineales bacterium]
MNRKEIITVSLVSIAVILLLDLLTNSLDTTRNVWDFVYYISMAKDGLNAEPLASPFAYRFLIPGLVNLLSRTGLSIESGFKLIAYIGAFTQLTGIFLFVRWLGRSSRGAWIALLVTAFSLFNVKFLIFDPFRPDHLAYALILLQTYFALKRKFLPLLLLTLIGSMLREFTLIPIFAYIFMLTREKVERSIIIQQGIISLVLILLAMILPRIWIPVTESYQLIDLSANGLLYAIVLPFIPSFPVNFIFSILAYFLPLFLLVSPKEVRFAVQELPESQRWYLAGYTILVLLLSFFGGTDYNRFATFLFLPQVMLLGTLENKVTNQKLIIVLACLFIFNRLWMYFPDWDIQTYRNFYGGFALQLNIHTLYRILELAGFIFIGYFLHRRGILNNSQM